MTKLFTTKTRRHKGDFTKAFCEKPGAFLNITGFCFLMFVSLVVKAFEGLSCA
jgi:hypothetical protein